MAMRPSTYRNFLLQEFESRSSRNARYSLRAFARDIALSPSSLSLVLSGKQGLSRVAATRISGKLGLAGEEGAWFLDLVEAEHGRTESARRLARIRLRKQDSAGMALSLELFRAISDWHHLAILELTELEGFESSPRWIARALGINARVARAAVARLRKLGLLEEGADGRLRQTEGFLATPSGVPSEAIKSFHRQILAKAEAALLTQPVEERDFSALIFPMRRSELEWAKGRLKEFRREVTERLEQAPAKDRIYCLSMQLFGLQAGAAAATHAPSLEKRRRS